MPIATSRLPIRALAAPVASGGGGVTLGSGTVIVPLPPVGTGPPVPVPEIVPITVDGSDGTTVTSAVVEDTEVVVSVEVAVVESVVTLVGTSVGAGSVITDGVGPGGGSTGVTISMHSSSVEPSGQHCSVFLKQA
jgi:hypothetical protein